MDVEQKSESDSQSTEQSVWFDTSRVNLRFRSDCGALDVVSIGYNCGVPSSRTGHSRLSGSSRTIATVVRKRLFSELLCRTINSFFEIKEWKRTRTRTRTKRELLTTMLILQLFTWPSSVKAQTPSFNPSNSPTTLRGSDSPSAKLATSTVPTTQSPVPTTAHPTTHAPISSSIPSSPPSWSMEPSVAPTNSSSPSAFPTLSFLPTSSISPSVIPSGVPSSDPTFFPTMHPSQLPTFSEPSIGTATFRQAFVVGDGNLFTPDEQLRFQSLYENYTAEFGRLYNNDTAEYGLFDAYPEQISATCTIETQQLKITAGRRSLAVLRKTQQFVQQNEVDFRMTYESSTVNVTRFPSLFFMFLDTFKNVTLSDLQQEGFNVTEVGDIFQTIADPAEPPSSSPTSTPTGSPSVEPTASPTYLPSNRPSRSLEPTSRTRTSLEPSMSSKEPTSLPTSSPTASGPSDDGSLVLIIMFVGLVAIAVLFALLMFYRKRQRKRMQRSQAIMMAHKADPVQQVPAEARWEGAKGRKSKSTMYSQEPTTIYSPNVGGITAGGIISPSESLVSNQSLLSAGNSMAGDSGDEADTTQNLQDEFDKYKDQNLEKFRADVEENLTGFDGIISQAVTHALMDDDDILLDDKELLWGGSVHQSGTEIETSALCETARWLKSNETASVERRRAFMQDMLNKMVSSVRHGILEPDDASRAIHECAALLNLPLASELPMTTVIVTGMPKFVTSVDVIEAFREFGDIDNAAVASNQRGFGIVRFKSPKSVDRAIRKYRNEEIVVHDVGVQVKVLAQS